jgi:predicted ATP-binding protein involved in virulence
MIKGERMGEQRRSGLRFAEIHLRNWRNFFKVDVPLQWRAFLVGPNASGKSNFLDVFRFLSDIVTVGGGFQEAVLKPGRVGVSRLRCLAARKNPNIIEFIFDPQKGWRPPIAARSSDSLNRSLNRIRELVESLQK